jgi:hypothetical protein
MSWRATRNCSHAPFSTPLQTLADTRQGPARCVSKSSIIGDTLAASRPRPPSPSQDVTPASGWLSKGWRSRPVCIIFPLRNNRPDLINCRYTLTYTPSADRILPAPKYLHVKVKNTSAIPLRAAYLHGPYTLYVACYLSTFDPNSKHERAKEEGVPEYEPNLKAGAHWNAKLTVPEQVREAAGGPPSRQSLDGNPRSFTWIIEVASQVIFSTTAAVHFEVLVGRDERSVDLGFHAGAGTGQGAPGKLEDHQQGRSRNAAQPKGVYSKAVRLAVDDTDSLWNTPAFPQWDVDGNAATEQGPHHGDKVDAEAKDKQKSQRKTKVHLVVLTHGLHSNIGADMLYLKESIDTAAKQAREDSRRRKAQLRNNQVQRDAHKNVEGSKLRSFSTPEVAVAPTQDLPDGESDDDEEQVIVRGFTKNAVKTENGIQYLGKRLAKWVLCITYPDQPYLPAKSSISKSITRSFNSWKLSSEDGQPTHRHSSIVKDEEHQNDNLAYKITSISFVSHSLGGNIQTYAIAYIQKHSPEFFDLIKPINFIAMASPFLGLSNENPIYVKFALDFGLVGRTGQDLGLTWKAPTIARSGWEVMIGGLSGEAQKARRQPNPAAKPLLRVLPTGPAHVALKKFRNRTVYSNVVNDGIVPLRTSCLLFLDWRGLGRVEKACRENGLVGTMVGWGWSEMMGQNASSPRRSRIGWNDLFNDSGEDSDGKSGKNSHDHREEVPQPSEGAPVDNEDMNSPREGRSLDHKPFQEEVYDGKKTRENSPQQPGSIWAGLFSFLKPQSSGDAHVHPQKKKIYYRGQVRNDSPDTRSEQAIDDENTSLGSNSNAARKGLVRGSSLYTNNSQNEDLEAPPKTTFFESAGDLLNPPLPPEEYLVDPEARPRTIFHDRIYHPEDIPPPPTKRQRSLMKTPGSRDGTPVKTPDEDFTTNNESGNTPDFGNMKIEEKIARAYHKDLSWRKVLVRLEPDAHNNMIVRRMFANAYGWPVVKHLCDTHFAYTAATQMPDDEEENKERAKASDISAGNDGEEVYGQTALPEEPKLETDVKARTGSLSPCHDDADGDELPERMHMPELRISPPRRTESEARESTDEVKEMASPTTGTATATSSYSSLKRNSGPRRSPQDSAKWSDRFFDGSEDDSDDEDYLTSIAKDRDRRMPRPINTHVTQPEIANVLTQSPKESTVSLPVKTESEALEATKTSGQGPISGRGALGLTNIGLSKKPEEHMTPAQEWTRAQKARRKAHPSLGVVEQIAIATAKKRQGGENEHETA